MSNTNQIIKVKGCEKAVQTYTRIKISVEISNSFGFVEEIRVLFNKYGQKPGEDLQEKLEYVPEISNYERSFFEKEIIFSTSGYRTYVFEVVINGKKEYIKYDSQKRVPILTNKEYPFFEMFVYEKDFETPDWVKGGIMYQIYVDTFYAKNIPDFAKHIVSQWGEEPKWRPDPDGEYRNDKYFGGNIEGIIEKVPYLHSLGVNIVYLTPIFKSNTSHRYSILDYEKIDEMVGDWDLLEQLKNKLHEYGMYLVLDVVFNHCNPLSRLYQENRELFTGNFWWGFKDLAEFRMDSEAYLNFLVYNLNLYLKYCDGLRFDVADQLPDEILAFIRTQKKKIEERTGKKIWMLGEVWKNAITGDYRGFLSGKELDSVMNYQFADAIYRFVRWGDYEEFRNIVFDSVLKLYPKPAIDTLMNPLSTHDIPRISNILTNRIMLQEKYVIRSNSAVEKVFLWDYDKKDELWIEDGKYSTLKRRTWEFENTALTSEEEMFCKNAEKLLVFIQYTLSGIPCIFAGDEFGLLGMKDPGNRRCIPWDKKDNERFTTYMQLGIFRKSNGDVLAEGECKLVYIDEKMLIYDRISKNRTIRCIVNRTYEEIPCKLYGGDKKVLFSFKDSTGNVIKPYDVVALEII